MQSYLQRSFLTGYYILQLKTRILRQILRSDITCFGRVDKLITFALFSLNEFFPYFKAQRLPKIHSQKVPLILRPFKLFSSSICCFRQKY